MLTQLRWNVVKVTKPVFPHGVWNAGLETTLFHSSLAAKVFRAEWKNSENMHDVILGLILHTLFLLVCKNLKIVLKLLLRVAILMKMYGFAKIINDIQLVLFEVFVIQRNASENYIPVCKMCVWYILQVVSRSWMSLILLTTLVYHCNTTVLDNLFSVARDTLKAYYFHYLVILNFK